MNLKECLEKGFIIHEKVDRKLIEKELNESDYDLLKAKESLSEKDYKWCIIKSYYAMFHAAKAVLFDLGYREKKHIAIIVMIEELCKEGKLESKYLNYFKADLPQEKMLIIIISTLLRLLTITLSQQKNSFLR